ncbi:AAA family ATPase [Bradyrhizobium septentrionale]|uniref:Uncharacterized protein n=1 Tax=Bradyrhizobium septentrionale TaxID=1404411 RepID=A0ABZ2P0W9_9BRAD|nr:hypothetical protein [Bradyrhizobium septentrionale]UGY17871.1 hypothetical protein HAP48_0010790 [Bradyrhizobium septentrionale]UGY26608.1 hypothetical protein HU675_0007510 [Bradyrhizobium septentrionale]
MAQGISVILDAAFLKQAERDAARAVACNAKVEFSGLFLSADQAIRVVSRRHDVSDATADVVLFQDSIGTGNIDWQIVDASGSSATTLQRSVSHLRDTSFPPEERAIP